MLEKSGRRANVGLWTTNQQMRPSWLLTKKRTAKAVVANIGRAGVTVN
jgi:hypothetical protein